MPWCLCKDTKLWNHFKSVDYLQEAGEYYAAARCLRQATTDNVTDQLAGEFQTFLFFLYFLIHTCWHIHRPVKDLNKQISE